jgi:hypothetical protein
MTKRNGSRFLSGGCLLALCDAFTMKWVAPRSVPQYGGCSFCREMLGRARLQVAELNIVARLSEP